MIYRLIGFILALLLAAYRLTCQAQTNLLATLKASDLAKWQTRNAAAFLDAGSGSPANPSAGR